MPTTKKHRYPQHSPKSSALSAPTVGGLTQVKMEDSVERLESPFTALVLLGSKHVAASVLSKSRDFHYTALPHRGKMQLTLVQVPGEETPRLIASERIKQA